MIMHWPRIHLPPGSHRNQRIVRPMLPPGVIGQWRGPNLLVDGNAEAPGVSAWTVLDGTLAKGTTDPLQGDQTLTIQQDSSAAAGAQQTVMSIGTVYRLTGWVRCDGSSSLRIYDDGYELWYCDETDWTPFDIHFLSRSAFIRFFAAYGAGGNYIDLDDLYLSAEAAMEQNLLADGRMEDPYPGWRVTSSTGSASKITDAYAGDYALRLTRGSAVLTMARQVLEIGVDYRLTGVARSDGVCSPRILDSTYIWVGTTSTEWQDIDITWTAASATLIFYTIFGTTGNYTEWDELVLLEV